MTALLTITILFFLAGCGQGNTTSCTTTTGTATARSDTQYNGACAPGEVLVGYATSAIGGPLLCATLTVSCPVQTK